MISYLHELADAKSKNGSYLIGFLEKIFPNNLIIDAYLDPTKLERKYPAGSIIYVDDEIFINGPDTIRDRAELLEAYDSHVAIVKIKKHHERLKDNGHRGVLFPWWHIVDDAISLHLLNQRMELPSHPTLAFSCFNRNWTTERQQLINQLHAYRLLEHGWVTAAAVTYYRPIGLRTSDLDHYQTSAYGFERHQSVRDGISISANTVNYLHINSQHTQPINISCETLVAPFFPTEKSFLGFFTKRLPIIIAEKNRVKCLREQGFDLFDDIIDHRYDDIEDSNEKIEYAIRNNIDLLKNPLILDDRSYKRLNNNFYHLTNTWLDAKLIELVDSIKHLINTWKK